MQGVVNFFKTIWKYWKKFGEFMGNIVGRVFLMVFYFTVMLPFGALVRLFMDPLRTHKAVVTAPAWVARKSPEATVEELYNQF